MNVSLLNSTQTNPQILREITPILHRLFENEILLAKLQQQQIDINNDCVVDKVNIIVFV